MTPMPTVRDFLTKHQTMWVDCRPADPVALVQRTQSRSDTVFRELLTLELAPQEGHARPALGDALVYSVPL